MKNNWILSLFALLTFACGSVDDGSIDDGSADLDGNEGAVAELDQSLVGYSTGGPASGGKTTGVRTATNRTSCDGTSGEVCLVPNYASKSVKWGISTPGFQAREVGALRTGVQRVDGQLTGWTLTEGTGSNFAFSIGLGTISGDSSSTVMDRYLHWFPNSSLTNLSENLSGSYQAFTLAACNVDIVKARQHFPVDADREKFLIHVGGACAMMSLGAGMRTDSNATNSFSFRTISTLNATRTLTTGERCRLNNYQLGNAPAYAVDGGTCLGLP